MTIAVKNKKSFVIPPAALRQAGFKSGQELEVKVAGGAITILPKLPVGDDEYASVERRVVDRGIAASEQDYKEGRSYGPFRTHEEFVSSLHAEAAKLRGKKRKRPAKRFWISPSTSSGVIPKRLNRFRRPSTSSRNSYSRTCIIPRSVPRSTTKPAAYGKLA